MNDKRVAHAAGLIGEVMKVEADAGGQVCGPFLRARVAVEIDKPLQRGVMLKAEKSGKPDWYDAQYQKLPFFCFSCGVMGHTKIDCSMPVPRNVLGKLPYDIKLCAPTTKRRNCRVSVRRQLNASGRIQQGCSQSADNPTTVKRITWRMAKRICRQ
jgi:hypothetical protein